MIQNVWFDLGDGRTGKLRISPKITRLGNEKDFIKDGNLKV